MRVAVVGATGVLGRAVLPRLLERGHEVVAVARNPVAIVASSPRLRAVAGDILVPATLAAGLRGRAALRDGHPAAGRGLGHERPHPPGRNAQPGYSCGRRRRAALRAAERRDAPCRPAQHRGERGRAARAAAEPCLSGRHGDAGARGAARLGDPARGGRSTARAPDGRTIETPMRARGAWRSRATAATTYRSSTWTTWRRPSCSPPSPRSRGSASGGRPCSRTFGPDGPSPDRTRETARRENRRASR